MGHDTGDKVLVAAVERLRRCVPATGTISRLSGDEFVIILTGVRDSTKIASMADAICDAFVESVAIDGNPMNVTFSIGISVFPNDGSDFDTLLRQADTAVHNAKECGRNTYRFFTHEMNADVLDRVRLTSGLLDAVRNQEFILHYQPQIHIDSGRITGAEALVRWQHPVDGLIPPAKFIPLAEQSGYIIQMGHTLQLTVIAEGVETEAQLAFLGGSGCDEAQGYLFSRPVPVGQFVQLLGKAWSTPS